MSFLQVGRKSDQIMNALAQAPLFKKQGQVIARPAVTGETITTILGSGAKETDNTAQEGDYIVTNLGGEQYIISGQKFTSRYEKSDEAGVYNAKGYCRAISNPFGQPIKIMASWGSPQSGDAECLIADTCDENGTTDGEPYLIEKAAFLETYKEVSAKEVFV